MATPMHQLAREQVEADHLSHIGDDDLIRVVVERDITLADPLSTLAWASVRELGLLLGISRAKAARLAAVFELGRRGAWAPPHRGERCLDPGRVYELLRRAAHDEREGFHVVLLDVRGRLIRAMQVAEGSLSQCPVSPRDALRPAVREGAHSVVFCHNHPSGVMHDGSLCAAARP